MPNIVKYSTGSESQSLKKNNFYIGLGDVGKGPTSNSGFYNGYVPPSGGYTIYLNKDSGGPSIYTCSSSSELIALTNKISGQNFSTIYQCFTWFQNQSDKMIVNRDYETYITNGLDMHIDAGFLPSYPQSGTSLLNLTYSATTGDLYNGVSWGNYGVGGAFLFDGIDDGIQLNYSSTNFRYLDQPFTICVWANKTQTAPGTALVLRGNYQAGGAWNFGFNNGTGIQFFTSRNNPSSIQTSTSNIISNNTWYYVAVTFDQTNASCKLYCNGVDVTGSPVTMQIPNANAYPVCFNLGVYNCIWSGGYKEFYKGYIAMVSTYGRLLSSNEILQNFNTTKSRFGY